jgi:hypothetical protein
MGILPVLLHQTRSNVGRVRQGAGDPTRPAPACPRPSGSVPTQLERRKLKGATIKNSSSEDNLDTVFVLNFWVIITAAIFVSLYAALEFQILYADGTHYLLSILEKEGFAFIEPSRCYAHFLQQFPTVLAMRLGVDSILALTICYGIITHLLPLLLIIICYFVLPPYRKVFFVFPLLHYLAGTTSSSFVGILEGPVAAAYFWLLLYLLLFRFERSVWMVVALLALPIVYLHEVMVFLAPLLAAVAGWRASQEQQKTSAMRYTLLAIWFLVVVAVQIFFVINPRDPANRGHFVQDLIHLRWLVTASGHVNVPALAGLFAIFVLAGVDVIERFFKRTRLDMVQWLLVIGFAVVSLSMIAVTFVSEKFITPGMQFSARNQSALISFPLALFAILSTLYPSATLLWKKRQNLCVITILAVTVLSWHVAATHRWVVYLNDFRSILVAGHGLVSWKVACGSLPDDRRSNFQSMSWPWTNPTLSFMLSPKGRVTAVIANPDRGGAWEPFDPNNPKALPHGRFFDSGPYRSTLKTNNYPAVPLSNRSFAQFSTGTRSIPLASHANSITSLNASASNAFWSFHAMILRL